MIQEFEDYFKYNPELPSCLERTNGRYGVEVETSNGVVRMAGYLAKQKNGRNVWKTKIHSESYNVSRIVFSLWHGIIEDNMVIDHIDGNETNNEINNLRMVAQAVNTRNRKKGKNNSSGTTGVSVRVNQAGNVYASANWVDNSGTIKVKYFPFSKYGEDIAMRLAKEYREQMVLELNSIGLSYSERHGK